jgi:hypothetical protein
LPAAGIVNFNIDSKYQVEGQWLIQLEQSLRVFNPTGSLNSVSSTKIKDSSIKSQVIMLKFFHAAFL